MESMADEPEPCKGGGVEFPGLGVTIRDLPVFDRICERGAREAGVRSGVEARFRQHALGLADRLNLGGGVLARERATIEKRVDF